MKIRFYVLLSTIKLDSIILFKTNTQYPIIKSNIDLENAINKCYWEDPEDDSSKIILTYIDPSSSTFKSFNMELNNNDNISYDVKYVYSDGTISDTIDDNSCLKEFDIVTKIMGGKYIKFPSITDFENVVEDRELLYEYALNRYVEIIDQINFDTDIEIDNTNESKQSVLDILQTLIFEKYVFLGNIFRVTQKSYFNLWIQENYNIFNNNPLLCSTTPLEVNRTYDLNEARKMLQKIKIIKNSSDINNLYLEDLPWFKDIIFHTVNGYCISIVDNKISIHRNIELVIPEKYSLLL